MTKKDFTELARQLAMCKPDPGEWSDAEYQLKHAAWKECVLAVNTANRYNYKGNYGYDSGRFIRACGLDLGK